MTELFEKRLEYAQTVVTTQNGDLSVNSPVPLKQLSSTPMQGRVELQVPARLSLALAQAGHSFPFNKTLGATDRGVQGIKIKDHACNNLTTI